MNALKKPQGVGKVFVAGEYWEDGDETQTVALQLGYGVLYEKMGMIYQSLATCRGYHFCIR